MQLMKAFYNQICTFSYTSLILCIIVYIAAIATSRIILTPLRSVPGPWYAAISDLWLTSHVLRLRRCRAINDLLTEYGPIVRVAPNKIIFNDTIVMKSVYGVRNKLSKSIFYKCLQTNSNDHAMTVIEHGKHLARKKGYVTHYLPGNLSLFQSEIHNITRQLIMAIDRASQMPDLAIDALLLFRHFLIDINCLHIFNYQALSLKAWEYNVLESGPADTLATAISDFPKRGLLRSALPPWIWRTLESIPIKRWQFFCDSDAFLGRFVIERLHEAQSSKLCDEEVKEGEMKSLMIRLLEHSYPCQEPMPDADIISECQGHLIAGTDTTSTTLSYILWELSRRPDVRARLQEELDDCIRYPGNSPFIDIPDIETLRQLPYLDAVIREGLRIYTAGPSPLERVVPESTDGTEFIVLGHTIPPGTIIASQAWSSHRDPRVFLEPEHFKPERWLPATHSKQIMEVGMGSKIGKLTVSELSSMKEEDGVEDVTQKSMSAHMFPFGYGPRACGGQNLAQILLRIVIASILRRFDIKPAEGTDEKSMDIRDSFVIFPAAMECKLMFIPRHSSTDNSEFLQTL